MQSVRFVALCVVLSIHAVDSGVRPQLVDVTLLGGVYGNVLVAISRDVPEDQELIDGIKVWSFKVIAIASATAAFKSVLTSHRILLLRFAV